MSHYTVTVSRYGHMFSETCTAPPLSYAVLARRPGGTVELHNWYVSLEDAEVAAAALRHMHFAYESVTGWVTLHPTYATVTVARAAIAEVTQ